MADRETKGGAPSGASSAKKKSDVPQNDREIADATGVTSAGEKVRELAASKRIRRYRNPDNGLETIEGETVEEVRARVKKEREETEPSEFQKSILGGPGPVIEREPLRGE